MERKDLVIRCGRFGLLIAAFALISGIIAAPLIERIWSPTVVAQR